MNKNRIILDLIDRADKTITARIIEVMANNFDCFNSGDRHLLKLKVLCLDLMDELKNETDI